MLKKILFSLFLCLTPGCIYSMDQNELAKKLHALDEQEKHLKEETNQKLTELMSKIQHREQVYQGKLKDIQLQQEKDKKFAEEMMKMMEEITKK